MSRPAGRNARRRKSHAGQLKALRARAHEAEELLRAVTRGEIDALVQSGPSGAGVFTLAGADIAYRLMVETMSEGAATLAPDGLVLYANHRLAELLQVGLDQVIGHRLHDYTFPAGHNGLDKLLADVQAEPSRGTLELRRADGTAIPGYIAMRRAQSEQATFIVAVVTDLSELRRSETEQRQAAAVFESTSEGIMITDAAARIIQVNAALAKMSGYARSEIIGREPSFQKSGRQNEEFYRNLWESIQVAGHWQGEIWNRRKTGEDYPAWEHISAIRDAQGNITNYVAILADISVLKHAEANLARLAHHDPLTGLPNRLQFDKALHASLERARRSQSKLAVLFIDLDNFKLVNDSMGHAAGDELLRQVGSRLEHCVRGLDTVARLGGDEFSVVLEGIDNPDDAAGISAKIIATVREPATVDGRVLVSTASVGISVFPEDAQDGKALMRNADAALYRAKRRGRNTYEFYSPDLTAHAAARLALEQGLRHALSHDELTLNYQPQHIAASGRVCGMEALLRWHDPKAGVVLPDRFIGVAEESQLIESLGDWVIDRACRQARAWLDAKLRPMRMSINVSARQLMDGHLIERIEAALETYRLTPADLQLEIELTERALVSIQPGRDVLARLRALGVRISIDDFGTGYSSLALLRHLPVDAIKVAQVFMRGVPGDPDSNAIVTAVLAIAHTLGLAAIGEGVETQEQLDFLREHGCDEIQGYVFEPALPAEQAALLLPRAGAAGSKAENRPAVIKH